MERDESWKGVFPYSTFRIWKLSTLWFNKPYMSLMNASCLFGGTFPLWNTFETSMHPHILLENRQVGPIQLLSYQPLHSSLPKQPNQASTHITINRQEAGPGGRGGGLIQRTSTGLGLRRSMTGPPALPPASSMMLEEVGSHLGLRVNSLNCKTWRVSQVICGISSSSDPRISVQKAAESHSQRAAQWGLPSSSQGDHLHVVICNKELSTGRRLPALWLQLPKGKGERKGGLRLKQGEEFMTYQEKQVRDIYAELKNYVCVSKKIHSWCVDEELRWRKMIKDF